MIVRPSTPGGWVLFCDDIREEVRGLKTYVGCYASDIVISDPLPVMIPKLGFSIRYIESVQESDEEVRLVITIPAEEADKDQKIFEAVIIPAGPRDANRSPSAEDSDLRLTCLVDFIAAPLFFVKPGYVKVRAYRGDLEIRLGSLKIVSTAKKDTEISVS